MTPYKVIFLPKIDAIGIRQLYAEKSCNTSASVQTLKMKSSCSKARTIVKKKFAMNIGTIW